MTTKDAYYFPHFSNARHDRKIKRIIKELGVEGYGIYFMLLEVLREQTDLRYPMGDIDLLADEFRTSEAKIQAIIVHYDLFSVDESQMFFSPKQIQYLQPYFDRSSRARDAANKRWSEQKALPEHTDNEQDNANDMQMHMQMQSDGNASKVKYSKVKESKVKDIEARKKEFYESLIPYTKKYRKDMIRKFYEYWTEPSRSGKKLKHEMERTWDTARRLNTWHSREHKTTTPEPRHPYPNMNGLKGVAKTI